MEQRISPRFGAGKCKIIVTDMETGEKLLDAEGYMKNYSIHTSSRSQPIEMMGMYGGVEEALALPERELSFTAVLSNPTPMEIFKQEEKAKAPKAIEIPELTDEQFLESILGPTKPHTQPVECCDALVPVAAKNCSHVWKKYTGFMDNYDYCEKCNEKRT